MKLSLDSWVFKFLSPFSDRIRYWNQTDLCSIFWVFLIACFVWTLGLMLGSFAVWSVSDALAWFIVCITTGIWFLPDHPGAVTVLLAIMVTLATPFVFGIKYAVNRRVIPDIVYEAYRGWKDKYCVKIQFTSEQQGDVK